VRLRELLRIESASFDTKQSVKTEWESGITLACESRHPCGRAAAKNPTGFLFLNFVEGPAWATRIRPADELKLTSSVSCEVLIAREKSRPDVGADSKPSPKTAETLGFGERGSRRSLFWCSDSAENNIHRLWDHPQNRKSRPENTRPARPPQRDWRNHSTDPYRQLIFRDGAGTCSVFVTRVVLFNRLS